MIMYKQLIIARKDLNMSPGKLAAQVSHASMAFLTNTIRASAIQKWPNRYIAILGEGAMGLYRHPDLCKLSEESYNRGEEYFFAKQNPETGRIEPCPAKCHYETCLSFNSDLYEQWINGSFTKVVCEAKNKSQLEKAIKLAEELDLREGRDFFLIRDNCLTELEPEDEDGRTLTCIGFMPLPAEIAEKISKKFQLYK